MRIAALTLVTIGLLVLGCEPSTTDPADSSPNLAAAGRGNRIVHRVKASGSDIDLVGPGGDASFSLNAQLRVDGTGSGQWSDQVGHGIGGIHAVINCVHVVGNQAWVSGIVTSGRSNGADLKGFSVAARLEDNGTSANDPPDAISLSWLGDNLPCTDEFPYPLNSKARGQVTVR